MKAFSVLPLSKIKNPGDLLQKPGDKFSMEITKSGRKVAKLHAGGIKRSITQYPTGRITETISY